MTTCNTTNFPCTYGIYESHDDGNPRRCGDQQTLGEWFVGTAGMGWFYFKPTNGGHG